MWLMLSLVLLATPPAGATGEAQAPEARAPETPAAPAPATPPDPAPAPPEAPRRTPDLAIQHEAREAARVADATAPTIPAQIEVQNQMGKRFKLVEAVVYVDGIEVGHRKAAGGRELETRFHAYDGAIAPGTHLLAVELTYEGRNVGPFTYLDNYRFRVDSSYTFGAQASDRPAALQVVARERKGANVPMEQRPIVDIAPAEGSGAWPTSPMPAADARKTIVR
jgi:hypothetical protein